MLAPVQIPMKQHSRPYFSVKTNYLLLPAGSCHLINYWYMQGPSLPACGFLRAFGEWLCQKLTRSRTGAYQGGQLSIYLITLSENCNSSEKPDCTFHWLFSATSLSLLLFFIRVAVSFSVRLWHYLSLIELKLLF